MNPFDSTVINFINGFAHQSRFFDTVISTLMQNDLVKGGFIMAVFWLVWFKNVDDTLKKKNREIIIATIMGALIGVLIVRGIEHLTVLRVRPVINPDLKFVIPYGVSENLLAMWRETWYNSTSFPSDHAALFIGLTAGLLFISRPLGLIMLSYVLIIIIFPRVYVGVHYPSDVIVGGLIGASLSSIFNIQKLRNAVTTPVYCWYQQNPAVFYFFFFLLCYEVGSLFSGFRDLVKILF